MLLRSLSGPSPVVLVLALLALAAGSAGAAAWHTDLPAALAAAGKDGKPVLALVAGPGDAAGMDARHWLDERAVAPLVQRVHLVLLPAVPKEALGEPLPEPEAADPWDHEWRFAPASRLLLLSPAGKLCAAEPIPATRAELPSRLRSMLTDPGPVEDVVAAAEAQPGNAPLVTRAMALLCQVGEPARAAALAQAAAAAAPEAARAQWNARAEELAIAAAHALSSQVARASRHIEGLARRPPAGDALRDALKPLVPALEAAASGAEGGLPGCVARARKVASGDAMEDAAKLLGELAPLVKARAAELRRRTLASQNSFAAAHPANLKAQLWRVRYALDNENDTRSGSEPEARRLLRELLARPMSPAEGLAAAGPLADVTLRLDLAAERAQLAAKLRREAPAGRATAAALLDLADEALAQGAMEEAETCWQGAIAAADRGESPTFAHAARVARSIARGEGSPERSPWARRRVLDVVVLAQDMPSFAAAIARWSDREFFPVLFADDLYAPRFVAAFRPARVLLLPPAADAPVPPEALRGAILASWGAAGRDGGRLAPAGPEALRARLRALGITPPGVVLSDGVSGETAGGLALAAGRFQGFEILPVPQVGAGPEARPARAGDHLSRETAGETARQAREALERWVPAGDTWPGITLAGAYPFRYAGEPFGQWGATYALDDLLGRAEDGRRIAVTGRLLGDAARSAYQAACALFLRPDSAYLFNTYGTNPASIWGYYRMDACEAALSPRLQVTHDRNKDASIERFRGRVFPWNPHSFVAINSSGGATNWSVGGGGGTADDFPVGSPCAIHVTHSGSAADPYNNDTLAGRALWGGAFWYFGSTAEPFLSAFQPPRYYGPRLAAGSPLAAAFRERPGQEFWRPWRLMVVGDPLFSLRSAPAERVPWSAARGPLVMPGETVLGEPASAVGREQSYPAWLESLRRARWRGDRAAARAVVERLPAALALDGPGLAMVLEEDLLAGDAVKAAARWAAAPEEARQHYAARVYARQAVGSLMDRALAAKDPADLRRRFEELLSTGPAANFVERWLAKLGALAKEKGDAPVAAEWLRALSADPRWKAYSAPLAAALKAVAP